MAIKHIACAAIPLLAAALPTQAVTLEQLNNQVQQINKRISEQENRLRINGFASFGFVQSDNEASYHRGITDEPNFRRYTKAGIQMSFKIDDQSSIITQLVSKGENDFDTRADWLYFKHSFGNGLSVKLGRLRKPNYLLSEFFDVGYAMPWTQPPVEVYGVLEASANYEAVDLTYDFEIGDWSAYTQFQYGRSVTSEVISKDLIAVNFSMNNGDLTLRAGYSQADAAVVAGSDTATQVAGINAALATSNKSNEVIESRNKGTFYGLAAMYDDGELLIIGEFNSLEVDSAFADQDGYYLMGGYRIGQWMPYLTFAHEETTDDSARNATTALGTTVNNGLANDGNDDDGNASSFATAGNNVSDAYESAFGGIEAAKGQFNKEQDRTAVGVRYDYKPGVAIKFQFDMVDTKGTRGEFARVPTDDEANIVSITIDTVF